jgi:hypothetical protein
MFLYRVKITRLDFPSLLLAKSIDEMRMTGAVRRLI